METVEIRKFTITDLDRVSELLTNSFLEDKGVSILFKKDDPKYRHKVKHWFKSTLKMLLQNKQNINCAFLEGEIIGVSVVSHSTNKPSVRALLNWTISVMLTCGITTVIRSAKHDRNRRITFTDNSQYILEFIAVCEKKRGKGIAKALFSNLTDLAQKSNASVWLETTKKENVQIFNKLGYNLVDTKTELAVDYHIMIKEKNK